MKCEDCNGLGCFVCDALGNRCDVCGEASELDTCEECLADQLEESGQ